jgi:hypothetical protein
MNADNRFPLEDCFKAVETVQSKPTPEQIRDNPQLEPRSDWHKMISDWIGGGTTAEPGDEHGAHETLEAESDMERDRR